MTWESTRTLNEKKESWKKEFTVHIGVGKPVKEVRFKEMNGEDQVIRSTLITKDVRAAVRNKNFRSKITRF